MNSDKEKSNKLRDLNENLNRAFHYSPFWEHKKNELGSLNCNFNTIEDYYSTFPLLNRYSLVNIIKQGIKKGYGYYYLSSSNEIFSIGVTGGTTGYPLIVPYTKDFWYKISDIAIQYYKNIIKLKYKDKIALFYDMGLAPAGQFHLYALRKSGYSVFPIGSYLSPARYISLLKNLNISTIFSSPQLILSIINYAKEKKISPLKFKINKVITSSSKLYQRSREIIEEFLDAETFQIAGATELLLFANECKYKCGLHLNIEDFLFEFLDTETKSDYKSLVVTTLKNHGFHLFRYKLGDLVKVNFSPCSCGNSSPRIEFVGRENLSWVLSNGIKIYDWQIRLALSLVDGFEGKYTLNHMNNKSVDILNFKIYLHNSQLSQFNVDENIKEKLMNLFDEFSERVKMGLIKLNIRIINY